MSVEEIEAINRDPALYPEHTFYNEVDEDGLP